MFTKRIDFFTVFNAANLATDTPEYTKAIWDPATGQVQITQLSEKEKKDFIAIIPKERNTPVVDAPNPFIPYIRDIHQGRAKHFVNLLKITGQDITLDVGCRTGHFVHEASQKASYTLGVEIDLEELDKAKQKFPPSERLHYTSDLLELLALNPDYIGKFNLITVFLCDGSLCNNRVAAEAINTLLAPGGRVVITSEFLPPTSP